MEGYLHGSTHGDKLIVNADRSKSLNPEYNAYKEHDSALASWLFTSISSSLLPNLVQWRTRREL